MTNTKKTIWRALPAMLALVLILSLFAAFALPAFAAEGAAEDDTSGSTEASVTFNPGKLKLNSVPTLNFGTQEISDDEQTYPAASVSGPIQVGDLRGNGKGWDLTVALSAFTLGTGGGPTLKSATISVVNPKVSAVNGTLGTPPAAVSELLLESDSTVTPVWTAGADEGMGVWNLTWNPADTKLTVQPGTAQQGTSVATLTWSLQTTP